MSTATDREKFDALRTRYLAKQARLDEQRSAFRSKYGSEWKETWLSRADAKKLERLDEAERVASRAFTDHLDSISARDWTYGVPVQWLLETLTFEDAVRLVGEKLSVVPPLSYGSTVPRT